MRSWLHIRGTDSMCQPESHIYWTLVLYTLQEIVRLPKCTALIFVTEAVLFLVCAEPSGYTSTFAHNKFICTGLGGILKATSRSMIVRMLKTQGSVCYVSLML